MASTVGKSADFLIRITIVFTIAFSLLYFYKVVPNGMIFLILFFLYIGSIIVKGIVDLRSKDEWAV